MAPAAAVIGAGDSDRLAREVARVLDECRASHAVQPRKLRELAALRSSSGGGGRLFIAAFHVAVTPLFALARRSAESDRVARFISAFASASASSADDGGNGFLEEFLRFLVTASKAAHRPARFRACQIISEIIMRLPDDAEVSDEIWDEVIDGMKVRVQDKNAAIRTYAVRALSRFAVEGEDGGIVDLFLETLDNEPNAEVRKTIVFSLPPSNNTLESVVESMLDISESVRRAAYSVLATKFPLQTLSIKQRTTVLHRGLSDRSASVNNECLKMLKDEWLVKYCGGDVISLLRFLDVETYESVGESVMAVLLKDGALRVQDGHSIRQYFTANGEKGSSSQSVSYFQTDLSPDFVAQFMFIQNEIPIFNSWMLRLLFTGKSCASICKLKLRPLEHEVDDDGNQIAIGDGAKQNHVDVQRAALRCLCLLGLLENRPNAELVKQLRLSFINGPDLVSAIACKALIDLVTWHGPQEIDRAIGIESPDPSYEKSQFTQVDLSDMNDDDLNIGVLDILFSGFHKDHWEFDLEGDNHDNVPTILGEGFAKILLLSGNFASIPADLHTVILAKLIKLYFSEETKELERLKQCMSVFFQHYPALSDKHKAS
ncbi:ARM repeat superfamily protein [Zea mays]|uniref:ARM repeat superfamily protein n=1 Tax=Zea mays TaxID=4577 RepID=A0A1D6NY53_MAIZE|nr:ARM repeat superfamily protein [Zea mays]